MPTTDRHIIEEIIHELSGSSAPNFDASHNDLRETLAHISDARPDVTIDSIFAARLKQSLAQQVSAPKVPTQSLSLSFSDFMNKFLFSAGAIAVGVLGVLLVQNISSSPDKTTLGPAEILPGAVSIIPRAQGGFGSFSQNTAQPDQLAMGMGAAGAVSGGLAETKLRPQSGGGGGDARMIMSALWQYRYSYTGEQLDLGETEMPVYRRVKGVQNQAATQGLVRQLKMGLADISRFSNLMLQSYTLEEDREFGYTVSVSIPESMVSIYENWLRWPHPESKCQDDACWNSFRLTEADMPSDTDLVAIADAFLAQYGIHREAYGAPVVMNEWRMYAQASGSELFVPDTVTVQYPLLMGSEIVYDQGGMPSGLGVNINVRHKKVSSLYGLTTQQYESSLYATVTDPARVVAAAERGGVYGYTDPNVVEFKTIELGTPERVLVRWGMNHDGIYDEVFVPALKFPVTKKPDDEPYFAQQAVVIPLVEEILNEQPPVIMPFVKEAEIAE